MVCRISVDFGDGLKMDLTAQLPPQDLESERALIGSVLFSNVAFDDVAEIVTAESFYYDANKRIWVTISEMIANQTAVDAVTLAERLEAKGDLSEIGGPLYIANLLESVPHAAHAVFYAKNVQDKWLRRQIIFRCHDAIKAAYGDAMETGEVLKLAEDGLFGLTAEMSKGRVTDLPEAFPRVIESLKPDTEKGDIKTGYADIDEKIGGIRGNELVVLAARPGMGKTALALNILYRMSHQQRQGVLFFSLEMKTDEVAARALSLHGEVSSHSMRNKTLNPMELSFLQQASEDMAELPFRIDDDPARSVSQITAIARREHRSRPLSMVVVDYLQIVQPEDPRLIREQQVATISRRLKALAKDLDVPVLALAQLNREVEGRSDKRPRMSDLRESGSIESDADIVSFIHRPDFYDPDDRPGEAQFIIGKHRAGQTGDVKLTWRGEFMRFENYSNQEKYWNDGNDAPY